MRFHIFLLALVLAGCSYFNSSEQQTRQTFAAFSLPCDRDSFVMAVKSNEDGTQTFTATCRVKR